jgi:hypothetical protein
MFLEARVGIEPSTDDTGRSQATPGLWFERERRVKGPGLPGALVSWVARCRPEVLTGHPWVSVGANRSERDFTNRFAGQAKISCTTRPWTSVSRKSRPA